MSAREVEAGLAEVLGNLHGERKAEVYPAMDEDVGVRLVIENSVENEEVTLILWDVCEVATVGGDGHRATDAGLKVLL